MEKGSLEHEQSNSLLLGYSDCLNCQREEGSWGKEGSHYL